MSPSQSTGWSCQSWCASPSSPTPPSSSSSIDPGSRKHRENAAQRTLHRLSRCQNVLFKRPLYICCSSYNLRFVIIQVLSQFERSFVTIWVFEFCHDLGLVTFWVIEFCHNLSFWGLLQYKFLSFITIWVSEFYQNKFFSFITIWVLVFHHTLSFKVSSQFEFLSFITI